MVLKQGLFWLAALAGTLGVAHAQDIAGDWQGTLKAGVELRVAVHFSKDAAGRWQGTFDSLDQGAKGIPLSAVTLQDSKLTFRLDAAGASYEGILNAAGTEIKGTFTQGAALPLDLKRTAAKPAAAPARPSDIDGAWLGTLDVGALKLRIALHITNTSEGLTATLDSLDQNLRGIPASSVTRTGTTLRVEMKALNVTLEGTISGDRNTIDGLFRQRGVPTPLVLKRVRNGDEIEPQRPQNPTKPYPYFEEDVFYENPAAGIRLAGTFTHPRGQGPFPAVLLITGSGPQDRDESLMGHKPFLVLSDYLTRKGIAVLRVDDRGVAKSGGNFATATTADFATDVEAGIAWLKTRSEVDPHRIGLVGHSEGGIIAPMVAARNRDIAFIVMLAGSAVRGDELLAAQVTALNEAGGMSHEDAVKAGDMERKILEIVMAEKDPAKLRQKLAAYLPKEKLDSDLPSMITPWYRFFLSYDPAVDLKKVRCPVLALNGSKDTQVPAGQNLAAIRKALAEGGNQRVETEEMPGLNHLMQHAKTGAPDEYATIDETISPDVLARVATWILAR